MNIPIVVTYNRLKATKWCLESLAHPDIKILVSDNASTDGTREYLDSLPHVEKVYHKRNLYMGKAWNTALPYALFHKPEYVGKVDNDVYFHQGWYGNFLAVAEASDADCVVITCPLSTEWAERAEREAVERNGVRYYDGELGTGCSFFIKADFLRKHPDVRYLEPQRVQPINRHFLNALKAAGGRIVQMLPPWGTLEKESYLDPDHEGYYRELYKSRGKPEVLEKIKILEGEGFPVDRIRDLNPHIL